MTIKATGLTVVSLALSVTCGQAAPTLLSQHAGSKHNEAVRHVLERHGHPLCLFPDGAYSCLEGKRCLQVECLSYSTAVGRKRQILLAALTVEEKVIPAMRLKATMV